MNLRKAEYLADIWIFKVESWEGEIVSAVHGRGENSRRKVHGAANVETLNLVRNGRAGLGVRRISLNVEINWRGFDIDKPDPLFRI